MSQTIDGEFYLIASKASRPWNSLHVRVTQKNPSLAAGEVAVHVKLKLPASLFTKPSLNATITVPADSVPAPTITAEVASNIAEIVKQQTGVDLHITVEAPPA